jgi:hypothetical protein
VIGPSIPRQCDPASDETPMHVVTHWHANASDVSRHHGDRAACLHRRNAEVSALYDELELRTTGGPIFLGRPCDRHAYVRRDGSFTCGYCGQAYLHDVHAVWRDNERDANSRRPVSHSPTTPGRQTARTCASSAILGSAVVCGVAVGWWAASVSGRSSSVRMPRGADA